MIKPHAIFRPWAWQIPPWRDTRPEIVLTGSAGGGKSHLAAEKLHAFCLRYPGAMALMLRKTRESMMNSTVLFMERAVIGQDPHVRYFPSKNRWEYANGSILAYGGMANEQQREQIRSIGTLGAVDICWMEEATRFTEEDYSEVLARMRGKAAPWTQIILSTNPGAASHWIHRNLILTHRASVYLSSAKDNPANPASYVERLAALTGTLGKRLRDGIWTTTEGAIYDEFDHALHIQERHGPWKHILAGVDYGYVDPATCLVAGLDVRQGLHIINEIYAHHLRQTQFIELMADFHQRYQVEAFYVDPSAAGLIAEMHEAGLPTYQAENPIRQGIQRIKTRLAAVVDGLPMLTFSELCHNTIGELEAYAWDTKKTDTPQDVHNHAMDALRYLEAARPIITDVYTIHAEDPLGPGARAHELI
jgi:PBSX family phage terminase large subunit